MESNIFSIILNINYHCISPPHTQQAGRTRKKKRNTFKTWNRLGNSGIFLPKFCSPRVNEQGKQKESFFFPADYYTYSTIPRFTRP